MDRYTYMEYELKLYRILMAMAIMEWLFGTFDIIPSIIGKWHANVVKILFAAFRRHSSMIRCLRFLTHTAYDEALLTKHFLLREISSPYLVAAYRSRAKISW